MRALYFHFIKLKKLEISFVNCSGQYVRMRNPINIIFKIPKCETVSIDFRSHFYQPFEFGFCSVFINDESIDHDGRFNFV